MRYIKVIIEAWDHTPKGAILKQRVQVDSPEQENFYAFVENHIAPALKGWTFSDDLVDELLGE